MGFFGYTVQAKGAPRVRHRERVDVHRAAACVEDILVVWREVAAWPDSQPFAGGVYDDWPHRMTRGLAVCHSEFQAVRDFIREEGKRHG